MLALALLVFWIWALVDVMLAREFKMGPRALWIVVVLLGVPPLGAMFYLAVGRKWGETGRDHPARDADSTRADAPGAARLDPGTSLAARETAASRGPIGPDDDPDFLASL